MDTQIGQLIIISGPSGAGKSTLVKKLLTDDGLPIRLSVSATTRARRPAEVPGQDYHFLSHEEFQRRRQANEFLEYKEVFDRGDWYGTLRSEVETGLANNQWVLLEIDVQGALSVLESFPDATTIFVHAGSLEILEKRLRDRQTDTEDAIQRRLEVARKEMELATKYRHEVINDSTDRAVEEIRSILVERGNKACSKN